MTKKAWLLRILLIVFGILCILESFSDMFPSPTLSRLLSDDLPYTAAALFSFALAWIVGRVDALTAGNSQPEQDAPQE